jgi:hypothetical protein
MSSIFSDDILSSLPNQAFQVEAFDATTHLVQK